MKKVCLYKCLYKVWGCHILMIMWVMMLHSLRLSLGASDSYPWTWWWYVRSKCWNPPISGWNSIVGIATHWAGWCGNWILGVKRPERGADCPPLSSARLQMDWSHTSAFHQCLHMHVIGQPLPLTHVPDWMESEPSTLQGKLFHILYIWRHLCLSMN